tara:strand:+ start:183 stop:386 length:204 start_codon:yes stop_codon:yes gene_type:complete
VEVVELLVILVEVVELEDIGPLDTDLHLYEERLFLLQELSQQQLELVDHQLPHHVQVVILVEVIQFF